MPVPFPATAPPTHALIPVATEQGWRWCGRLRSASLGVPAGKEAEDDSPLHRTFLLIHNRRPVGTVRVEQDPHHGRLILQRLGILPTEQRKGHGAALLRQIGLVGISEGAADLAANAAYGAIPWYLRNGFTFQTWDARRATATSRQMVRAIDALPPAARAEGAWASYEHFV